MRPAVRKRLARRECPSPLCFGAEWRLPAFAAASLGHLNHLLTIRTPPLRLTARAEVLRARTALFGITLFAALTLAAAIACRLASRAAIAAFRFAILADFAASALASRAARALAALLSLADFAFAALAAFSLAAFAREAFVVLDFAFDLAFVLAFL